MIYNLNNCYYNGLIIPMEIWKPITEEMVPGVRPIYWISNIGNLYNSELGRYSNASIKKNDYIRIVLVAKDGHQIMTTIHRLVCLAFHGLPPEKDAVADHINCNKECSLENNLEWVSRDENAKRAKNNNLLESCEERYNSILTNDEVEEICKMLEQGISIKEIGYIMDQKILPRKYSGGVATIVYQILNGYCWVEISSKYNFKNYSRLHLSSEEAHMVCKALCEGVKYDSIINDVLLRKDCSSHERERLKETFYNIKRGRAYKDIAIEYGFSKEGSTTIPEGSTLK